VFSPAAGRLLTSPVAFLFAGIVDFVLLAGATISRSGCSLTHRMLQSVRKIERR
jgi:hypothetical protein